ncbi:serine/threonine protein kinase [Phormidesmis sp. 146-35]
MSPLDLERSPQSMTLDPNLGRLINNRYRLIEVIGQGAMGSVYRAKDVLLGNPVAVKLLKRHLITQKACDRFENEAKVCAQLGQKSHHIVRVTDYGTDAYDVPFYVMEYLSGESLSSVIQLEPLSLPRFLRLALQICLGLQCAHTGIVIDGKQARAIVHRDIKPGNILISPDPSWQELVKILDFGIATMLAADEAASAYMGTPAYSAPEQLAGESFDVRSDIYSLGVTLFEMLTRQLPLSAGSPSHQSWYHAHCSQSPRHFREVAPKKDFPKALTNLIMSCLEKSPEQRPQSIAEILTELNPLVERHSREVSHDRPIRWREVKPISTQPEKVTGVPIYPDREQYSKSVFAHPFAAERETLPALWVMLPHTEIQSIQINKLYNQIHQRPFFCPSPHPMVMWTIAISNPTHGKRRLKVFLDLKSAEGQKMLRLMVEKQRYAVLFFDLEAPHCCVHQIDINLNSAHSAELQKWSVDAQSVVSIGTPEMSKAILRREFSHDA